MGCRPYGRVTSRGSQFGWGPVMKRHEPASLLGAVVALGRGPRTAKVSGVWQAIVGRMPRSEQGVLTARPSPGHRASQAPEEGIRKLGEPGAKAKTSQPDW